MEAVSPPLSSEVFRVMSWNCRRATAVSPAWDYFLDINPDLALLQEVAAIPARVSEQFASTLVPATSKGGGPLKVSTAILVRGQIGPAIPMISPLAWVDAELQLFAGNVVAHVVKPDRWHQLNAVSVYSPAFPVDRARLEG